ncbi:ion channel [Pontibacter chitinilyticus]|uniref:ion channel n=1 Tax=Pontibacter chitinilyticus TaxID=2674989 RepID=UPI0032192BEB
MKGQTIDPGLGEKYTGKTKRLINKDGSFNIQKYGFKAGLNDAYQLLTDMPIGWLLLTLTGLYLLVNCAFALLYLWFGIAHLGEPDRSLPPFLHAFFFSVQTFTTVGYGVLSPHGLATNLVVTVEALTGWIGFAIITGLVYRRFSQPVARILYSRNAIIAPYQGGWSLQFRIANMRRNVLMEMEARVMLILHDTHTFNRRYYNLKLERSSIYLFPLNWTIVHPIDEDSPLYNTTPEGLAAQEAEVLIMIKGFDETFAQQVRSRFSYRFDEVEWNVRFRPAYQTDPEGEVILDLERLHETEAVEASQL